MIPYLRNAELVSDPLTQDEQRILEAAAPLVQERMQLLGEAPKMLDFLFKPDAEITMDDDALKRMPENLGEVIDVAADALEKVSEFTEDNIEQALRESLIDGLGLKPRLAFGPVRTAVSGHRVSPPLFESLEILGKESTLARLRAFRENHAE